MTALGSGPKLSAQRRHWEPPAGIEVVGPLPRKYGTL